MENLKNYTSTIPADRSISRIERMLVDMGGNNINKIYEDRRLSAITFMIEVNGNSVLFKLPARVDVVNKVLRKEVKRPKEGTYERIAEQAERTAWKIISDWVEVQVAMISLEQAEFAQVFLPYVYDLNSGKTFYDKIKETNYKALLT